MAEASGGGKGGVKPCKELLQSSPTRLSARWAGGFLSLRGVHVRSTCRLGVGWFALLVCRVAPQFQRWDERANVHEGNEHSPRVSTRLAYMFGNRALHEDFYLGATALLPAV